MYIVTRIKSIFTQSEGERERERKYFSEYFLPTEVMLLEVTELLEKHSFQRHNSMYCIVYWPKVVTRARRPNKKKGSKNYAEPLSRCRG